MRMKLIEDFAKGWLPIIILALGLAVSWGRTGNSLENIKEDVVNLQEEMVPRSELDLIIERFDDAVDRLEANVDKLEGESK